MSLFYLAMQNALRLRAEHCERSSSVNFADTRSRPTMPAEIAMPTSDDLESMNVSWNGGRVLIRLKGVDSLASFEISPEQALKLAAALKVAAKRA